ncbi:MAG: sigma-70 family RNA polymerase sigma factor [Verrucomicrobiota bacterium]|jgi:RNA polymerase sigma factor (sigma-70 family)
MTPDSELLSEFARTRSEAEFAELVRRHVNLVYSAALRQVNGDTHLAQDVAQTVFADLARKAKTLAGGEHLTGWLYTSAHFAAAKIARTESRRRDREEKFMREPTCDPAPDAEWENLRPALDDAMHELKAADREAILLRYFENRPFAEVGAKLGLNENAARMRVDRALEKLRSVYARRGVVATSALAAAISANAVQMAPGGLTTALTATSLTTGAAGTGTFTLLKIMTATQIKLGISALLAAGAATALVVQHQALKNVQGENELLTQQVGRLTSDLETWSNRVAVAGGSKALPADQFNELLKLRGEVGQLRRQAGQADRLRAENERLQAAQRNAGLQPVSADAPEQEKQASMAKMNNAKQGMLAFIMFAVDNQQQYPTNFEQASRYLPDGVMGQIESGFDIAYQGSIAGITNPATTIVLKERQAWQASSGKWFKAYGFADGHSELHTEPDGNFDEWENQHTVSPAANQ